MNLTDFRRADEVLADQLENPEVASAWNRTALARAVATRVLGYRMTHGLSQTQLARLLQVSQPLVARLEIGEHEPTMSTLARLCRVLGMEFHIDITSASLRGDAPILRPEEPTSSGVVERDEERTADYLRPHPISPSHRPPLTRVLTPDNRNRMWTNPAVGGYAAASDPFVGTPDFKRPLSVLSADDQRRELRSRAYQLYIQSEAAEERMDVERALKYAAELYNMVVENRDQFDDDFCGTVGNSALTAEKFNAVDLAYRLYELAYDLDREHANNMQNYVEFIVDEELESLYSRAAELLDKLQTGPHTRHKFHRTLILRARLAVLQKEQNIPLPPAQIEQLIEHIVAHPDEPKQFRHVSRLLVQMGKLDLMLQMAERVLAQDLSPYRRYSVLRAFADQLASSGVDRLRYTALDVYRSLLASDELAGPDNAIERSVVLYNYGTLLYAYDYDEEAGRCWYEAYELRRNDEQIRIAYARYLVYIRQFEEAERVAGGVPVVGPVDELLKRDTKPTPAGSFLAEYEGSLGDSRPN